MDWQRWVLEHTGASAIVQQTLIQNLWGGYGQLLRLQLEGARFPSVILKRMTPPGAGHDDFADRRKRRSYQVEQNWYQTEAESCDQNCRIAACLASQQLGTGSLLLLEDLNGDGFIPKRPPNAEQIASMLVWLANFHARFLGQRPAGLWEQGGYWHLDTRPTEWQRMPSGVLKSKAAALDEKLKYARFQTLLHGDAKPANFCWNSQNLAAAVDFQYVGPGCGIRDVAYLLDCWLDESGPSDQADHWLELYFGQFRQALAETPQSNQAAKVEQEWRELYPVAWSDFSRFMLGWGHPAPLGRYSQHQLEQALKAC